MTTRYLLDRELGRTTRPPAPSPVPLTTLPISTLHSPHLSLRHFILLGESPLPPHDLLLLPLRATYNSRIHFCHLTHDPPVLRLVATTPHDPPWPPKRLLAAHTAVSLPHGDICMALFWSSATAELRRGATTLHLEFAVPRAAVCWRSLPAGVVWLLDTHAAARVIRVDFNGAPQPAAWRDASIRVQNGSGDERAHVFPLLSYCEALVRGGVVFRPGSVHAEFLTGARQRRTKPGRWGVDERAPLVGVGGFIETPDGREGYFCAVVRVGEGVLAAKGFKMAGGAGRREVFWRAVRALGKGLAGHGRGCCEGGERVRVLETYDEEGGGVGRVECPENGVVITGWRGSERDVDAEDEAGGEL